jgi:hypothetical protein
MEAGNISKATVRVEERDGRKVVVKDYGTRNCLIRLYGNMTLRREEGMWKVTDSDRYWASCWESSKGCQ